MKNVLEEYKNSYKYIESLAVHEVAKNKKDGPIYKHLIKALCAIDAKISEWDEQKINGE